MTHGTPFPFKEFVHYAGNDPDRWSLVTGGTLVHRVLGDGLIEDVILFEDQRRIVAVFDSKDGPRRKKLSVQALLDLQRITEIRLTGDSAELVELKRRFDQRAEKIARLEELASKFKLPARSIGLSVRLLEALELMDAGRPLPAACVDWLRGNEDKALVKLLADYRWREYRTTRDPWTLAQASGLYRDAGRAEHSIKVTEGFSPAGSAAAASAAVLTSRAAALADVERVDESYQCAHQALGLSPESAHICNLLGRLEYIRGHAELGDGYFAKAEVAASDPGSADAQRQKALKAAKDEVKRELARFLLTKDPKRYAWAQRYLADDVTGREDKKADTR